MSSSLRKSQPLHDIAEQTRALAGQGTARYRKGPRFSATPLDTQPANSPVEASGPTHTMRHRFIPTHEPARASLLDRPVQVAAGLFILLWEAVQWLFRPIGFLWEHRRTLAYAMFSMLTPAIMTWMVCQVSGVSSSISLASPASLGYIAMVYAASWLPTALLFKAGRRSLHAMAAGLSYAAARGAEIYPAKPAGHDKS